MGFRLSPEAEADLDDIWLFVARESQSVSTANRVIDTLMARLWILGQHPQIGRRRDLELRTGLRSFAIGQHVVIYRVDDGEVLILHVIRGGRDVEELLTKPN